MRAPQTSFLKGDGLLAIMSWTYRLVVRQCRGGRTTSYLEIWAPEGRQVRALDAERVALGAAEDSDVTFEGDETISGIHAVVERYGDHWSIRDLGSTNGTFVNGERIWGERRLRNGDEIRLGRTRLTYRADAQAIKLTQAAQPPPDLTRREREVLLELCRPLGSGDVFTEPASTKDVAKALVVTDAAVKQHLASLYDKFGFHDQAERRRVRLANEAIRRGAVSVAELKSPPTS